MRLFIERDLSDSWVGLPVHVKHKIGYHRVRVLGTDTTDTWCTNAYNTSGAIYAQMPTKIPPPLLSLLSVLSSFYPTTSVQPSVRADSSYNTYQVLCTRYFVPGIFYGSRSI